MKLAIAPHEALSASTALALSFVLSLYIWPNSTTLDRNSPIQIRRRFKSMVLVCIFALIVVLFWVDKSTGLFYSVSAYPTFFEWVGFSMSWQISIKGAIVPVLLTFILFFGPNMASLIRFVSKSENSTSLTVIVLRSWKHIIPWSVQNFLLVIETVPHLQNLRNYIVGPAAEEWVFRSCMMPLLICAGFAPFKASLISPCLFGLCHAHHVFDLVISKGVSIKQTLFIVCKIKNYISSSFYF